MRALLPLLSLSLLLAAPAFANDNGHAAHKARARSHDAAGARDQSRARGESGREAQARADAARAAAHAEAARAAAHADARAQAAHHEREAKRAADRRARERAEAAHARARAEAAHREAAHRAAARREAQRQAAARYYVARHRPPPPPARRVVVTSAPPPRKAKRAPAIFMDRAGQFSLGLTGGSLISGYDSGSSFGDMGLGVDARYRITPGFGLEASLAQHRGSAGDRISTPLSFGVQAFAFPTSRVNPYASAGVSFTGRDFDDTFCDGEEYIDFVADDTLFGPYGGLGLELALTENATVNLEGRLSTFMDLAEDDPTVPVAFQGLAGLNFYF
jgi:opacity protein-like surface antigen